MTQRKNVQQSTMAFATSCRHRRRKRVIRWKSCLWTLFQFNQSLPFSRKIHLSWLYYSCTKIPWNQLYFVLKQRESFSRKNAKLWKLREITSPLFFTKKNIKYILTKMSYLLFRTFGISALSPMQYNFLQSPKLQIYTHFSINSTHFHVTFWIKSFNDFSSRSFFPTQKCANKQNWELWYDFCLRFWNSR